MRLVYKFEIENNKALSELCKISKNLYNQTLYIAKQELNKNNRWLFYYDLEKIMKTTANLDGAINYKLLKAQVAQQCIKQVDKDIKCYIKAIKEWSKNKGKFNGKPKLPKYKKTDKNQLVYTNQCCQIKDGILVLEKNVKIHIPQWDKYKEKLNRFQQVQINPKQDGKFSININYLADDIIIDNANERKYASIDLGIDNLVTMIIENNKPIIYNGKQIKASNQSFNKEYARLKSQLNVKKKQYTSKRINRMYAKRSNVLNDVFHKLSRHIVRILVSNGITDIVVGYNKGWKDSIRLSHKNNQTFVQIPYMKLIEYLKYKCEMCGIRLITNEESYTSKCDSLVMEEIGKHSVYLGKRVKRGLFQSSSGKLLNADVNGALNIMRKVVDNSAIISRIINSGLLFNPIRIKDLFNLNSYKEF